MKKRSRTLSWTILCTVALTCTTVAAHADGLPWRDHAAPFSFRFGNHIDHHQQTKLLTTSGRLWGYLYIQITGKNHHGVPIAEHCHKDTPPAKCVIGWKLRAIPGHATFLYHHQDHPVWLVHQRQDIPQPGAFTHFHWVTPFGTDPRLNTTTSLVGRCDAVEAGQLVPGAMCQGYFLELKAVRHFVFKDHDSEVDVQPGIDTATHTNIVASSMTTDR